MIQFERRVDVRQWILSVTLVALLITGVVPLLGLSAARAAENGPAKTWKNITLLYTTDVKGKIDPCG